MPCDLNFPIYAPNRNGGLNLASSQKDGYSIALSWDQAFASVKDYQVSYNIYYSTVREDVFSEGVKFVSVDDGYTTGCILELDPGETYYFAVRGTQYSSDWVNLNHLQNGFPGLKVYTEGLLLSDISDTETEIPVSDISLWPAYGVIQIGTEWIRYTSKDIPNDTLIVAERGFLGTNIRPHDTDGYDGVNYRDPVVRFWKGLEEDNKRVQTEIARFAYPNHAYTETDGYAIKQDLLTADKSKSASDDELSDAPRYDGVGWHRTDPRRLLRGECIGTYYGGEQWCADGYNGVGRQLRGVSIEDQVLRREEFLLENFGGESTVLVKRLYKGIRCSCTKSTNEHPVHHCPKCFVPGTLVRSENGYKPIEQIKVGEKVLTSSGEYHKVKKVIISPFDGYLSSVLSSVSANPILSTPDHPFMVLGGNHNNLIKRNCGPKCNNYIKKGDGLTYNKDIRVLPSGKFHARASINGKRTFIGSFDSLLDAGNAIDSFRSQNREGHKIIWKEASDINEKDWLVPLWNKKNNNNITSIDIPAEFLKNTNLDPSRIGDKKFEITPEFLWIIGFYLAEGSCGKRTVTFALHKKEKEYTNKIVNYFSKKGFNPKVTDKNDGYGRVVDVYGTSIALWFKNWLGNHCYDKKIPEELMSLDPELQMNLVKGLWDGDGSKTINEKEITQTSEILALQISEILHRNNKQPLIRKTQSKILTPKGNNRKPAYTVSWSGDSFANKNRKGRWDFKDHKLSQVRKVSKTYYKGNVYNLEVESDHTYVVQGVIVHNCFGTGIVTGFQQFYNPRRSDGRILVRFGPSTEDIKFEDAGLENTFIPDCWTIAYPAIQDRDFIIRFDQDGNEEFRYEILDVTRNTVFQGLSGAQKFRARRVRKSEPIYQWRAFRNTATMPETLNTSIGMLAGPGGTMIPHTHQVVINEGVATLTDINQTTDVSESHNHPIIDGVVQEVLGHTHTIILP